MRKNWPLVFTLAGAALALQACDVNVHEAPKQDSTAATAPATESAPPATDTAAATNVSPAASAPDTTAVAPADTTATPPADTTAMANPPSTAQTEPQQPGTNAMGAAPAPAAPGAAMDTTPAGTAAPTELARFLQDNPPGGGKADQKAAGSGDSAGTQNADAKAEAGKSGKSVKGKS